MKASQPRIVTSPYADWPLSFTCPEDWVTRETPVQDGVKFFLRGPLDPTGNLFASITVQAHSGKDHTLSDLAREWIERRSAFRTFRLLARTETDLNECQAMQIDAAHDAPLPLDSLQAKMTTVQERVILALREERIYEFTYRATKEDFETHLPVFGALVASFSL